MRALLALMVLGGLFLIATAWQNGRTGAVRAGREARYGLPDSSADRDGEWSLLVMGAITGADPIPGAEPPGPSDPTPGPAEDPEPVQRPPLARDYRYEVQSGDHLGGICDRHYGTSRPGLVGAVARYNGLASPDAIRAGDLLLLPDRALLDE